ncbi:MAG: HYR domain-containing protein, partial [Saprospiraceae bacterium]
CSASVTYATPTVSDNCALAANQPVWLSGGTTPTTNGANSTSTFDKGTTTVEWKASDTAIPANTKTCAFTVTVNDTQKPTIACPANKTQGTDPGECEADVTYVTPTGADNCGLPTGQPVWISGGTSPTPSGSNSISTFQKGVTTVTWKATDEAGNTKTCTFKITVSDLEKPLMTCLPDISANNDAGLCSAVVTYTLPTFMDNCPPTSGQSVKISGPASGSAFSVGTSNVVYRATDASGNTKQCTLKVIVTDNQPPTIGCPGPIVVTGSGTPCKGVAVYANPTASDNCSGSLTPFLLSGLASGSQFPAGVTTNTWRAIAGNGQSADCAFMVTVECPMNAPGSPAGGESGMEDSEWGGSSQDRIPQVSETWRVSEHVPEQALSIRLYPNPNVGTFTVEMLGKADGDGEVEFALYDALGQWAKREQADFRSGNLVQVFQYGELPAGLYTLAIQNGKEVKFAKVVIQR